MGRAGKVGVMLLAAVAVLAGGYWWNEHRRVALRDAFNPFYWVRRARGQDLYDPQWRILYHGNRKLPEIALTIDDGPHEPTGREILDVLRARGARATFFVVGQQVKRYPDLVRRMQAEGHEIGNHTQDHQRLDTIPAHNVINEIRNCAVNIQRAGGPPPVFLRPPGMRYDDAVLRIAKARNYTIVAATITAHDATLVSPDFIARRVLRRVENGSILLLHDDHPATVEALPRILAALQGQGYRFVTISEMLAHLPPAANRR